MTRVSDYVDEKTVKLSELRSRFKMIKEFNMEHGKLDCCGNCADVANTMSLPAEPWLSALYCWKCKSITAMLHTDYMGGNHTDRYEVYGA